MARHIRLPYAASATLLSLLVPLVFVCFRETLTREQRVPFRLRPPGLGFVRLALALALTLTLALALTLTLALALTPTLTLALTPTLTLTLTLTPTLTRCASSARARSCAG